MTESPKITGPTQLPAHRWRYAAMQLITKWSENHVPLVAGGVAFFGLLALFPAITAAVAITGLVNEPQALVGQLQSLSGVLPDQAADIILGQARKVASAGDEGLSTGALIGLLIALYSSSRGTASLVEGLNLAYGCPESRGIIRLTLENFALTVALMAGLVVALVAAVVIPAVLAFAGLGPWVEALLSLLRWPLLLFLAITGLGVLYRHGPSRPPPGWRWVTPGATMATVLWLIGTALFAWYVGNFASYNQTFGALAGVIVLLMWMWVSAIIVLMGAELDAALERQAGRVD